MSAAEELPGLRTRLGRESAALAGEWRRFKRTATVVAILTSPAFFLVLYRSNDWSLPASLLCTIFGVIAFRGLVDVVIHKVIPWPNLYGAHKEVQDEDVVARRRVWFWRTMYRRLVWLVIVLFVLLVITNLILRLSGTSVSLLDTIPAIGQLMGA